MAKSVLSNVSPARFKNIDLDAILVDWTDTRKPRLAQHEYLKRDGALQEYMGRAPHTVKMNIVYLGTDFAARYRVFQASIDEDPKGLLVHPLIGEIQAACVGIDSATLNTETGRDLYLVPVTFVEDNVDQRVSAQDSQGLAAQDQTVQVTGANLLERGKTYPAASGVQTAITAYVTQALAFASTAFTAAAQALYAPQLALQLEQTRNLAFAAKRAILATATVQASVYNDLALIEQCYDACTQLLAAISVARPPLVEYVVAAPMHLVALAARLYGKDGLDRTDEILANNPGKIPDPNVIPRGTRLLVATPTVPQ